MKEVRVQYPDGIVVHLGDRVRLLNGALGTVVISVDTDEYSESFPRKDWASLEEGVLIEVDNGALVAIDSNERGDVRRA
jgi:hypothetical protein